MKGDADIRSIPVHRLVDGVVEDFPDEVVQPGRADAADVHPGALADGLQTFENRDVFRSVVAGGHVYNSLFVRRDDAARAVVSLRNCSGIPVPSCRRVACRGRTDRASGRGARGAARHGTIARPRALHDGNRANAVRHRGRSSRCSRACARARTATVQRTRLESSSRVPLPAAAWSRAVFRHTVPPDQLIATILVRSSRHAALPRSRRTRRRDADLFREHPALITLLYERAASVFAAFAGNIRIRAGRVVPPGGPEAATLWEAVMREPLSRARSIHARAVRRVRRAVRVSV